MDINVPLLLFIAVFISAVGCLVDIVMYRGKRQLALAALNENKEFTGLSMEEKQGDERYQAAKLSVQRVPVFIEYSKSFFPVLFVVFFLRSFVIEPFQIPSESMVPTLEVGDFIAVNKFAYGVRLPIIHKKVIPVSEPKRGDVMVFIPPHDPRYFIKRVVGLPGDHIQYINHELFINGDKASTELVSRESVDGLMDRCATEYILQDETFSGHTHRVRKCTIPGPLSRRGSWVVPAGHYFMMGDNRDNSADSRAWLFVPEENIVGKAFAIWMHWEKLLSVPSFSRVGGI